MAINFDTLPNDKGTFSNVELRGTYIARIEAADMKQGRDKNKPPYLNMRLSIRNKAGKVLTNVFDILADSEAQLVRYKIKRLIEALGLPLTQFELADLTKIVVGKELIVDLTVEKPEGYPARTVVDSLTDEIYYPITAVDKLTDDSTFNAPDAADAPATIPEPTQEY